MNLSSFPPLGHQAFYTELATKHLLEKCIFNMSNAVAEAPNLSKLLDENEQKTYLKKSLNTASAYTSTKGSEALRHAISETHQISTAEDCLLFSGAQEALFASMAAILKPGDEVIICTPCYPSLLKMPYLFGARPIEIPLTENNQWNFELDKVTQRISDKTRLIIINQPHNPTGSVLNQEIIHHLHRIIQEKNIFLITDEVALKSDFNHIKPQSLYTPHPKVIAIGVCSKSLGLAGLRIGWLFSASPLLKDNLLQIKSYLSICVSQADETLLTLALQKYDLIVSSNNKVIKSNVKTINHFIEKQSGFLAWHPPQAGLLGLIKINCNIPIKEIAELLLKMHGLLIVPSEYFGLSGNYFRIGLGKHELVKHLPTMQNFLDQLKH